MGRRGPLAKDAAADLPANVVRMRGEVDHATTPTPRRKLRPGRPAAPRGELDKYGRRIWNLVCEELEPYGLLSPVDEPILEAFARACQWARDAAKVLREQGLTVLNEKGASVKNPAWQIHREAVNLVEALGTKLALNPSARLRILHELEGLGAEGGDELLD
jgi:P27 family predicted phage terminase small subunit